MNLRSSNSKGPMAGQPLFTPISHPELKQLGQKYIHTFLREWDRYLLCIQDSCNSSGTTVNPIRLRSAIDVDLLQSLIELEEFGEEIDSINMLSDDVLRQWLEEHQGEALYTMTVEQLETIVKSSVRMNIKEPDPKLRALRLFSDYKTMLRTKKWEHLIKDNPKVAVNHIVELLKPVQLKTKVQNDIKLGKTSLRKNWKEFFKYVVEQTIACEAFVPANNYNYQNSSQTTDVANEKLIPQKTKISKEKEKISNSSENASMKLENISMQKTPEHNMDETEKPKKLPKCLNKAVCNEYHYVKDCPRTSEELGKKLVHEYKQSREKSDGTINAIMKTPNVPDIMSSTIQTTEGRIQALLAEKVPVTINGDYGADHSAISAKHLELCAKQGLCFNSSIEETHINEPCNEEFIKWY